MFIDNGTIKIMMIGSIVILLIALALEFIGLWFDNEYLILGAFCILVGNTVGSITLLANEKGESK